MSKPKILIVDDDPKITRLLAVILNRVGGYEVCEENRSFAALATARQFLPDLILLDVDMPGKDGGVVAAEIKNDPQLAGTRIIFVSSLVTRADAGRQSDSFYLSKPVAPQLLLSTVARFCPALEPAVCP